MKLSQRNMFAKAFATGLAFLSFAALAADKYVWNAVSGTEWGASEDNWGKLTNENGYFFNYSDPYGTSLNTDMLVTFADVYTIPYNLKFENNSNGNGLVTFRAGSEECGVSTAENIILGWRTTLGALKLEAGTYGAAQAIRFNGGTLTVENGATLACTNELVFSRYDADDTTLNINGGSVRAGGQIQLAYNSGRTSTCNITSGTIYSKDLFQVGLNGTGILNISGGTVESDSNLRLGTDGTSSSGTIVMTGGAINTRGHIIIGNNGTGRFEMRGGNVNISGSNKEFWVGGADNGNNGTGTLLMTGGAITNSSAWTSIGRRNTGYFHLDGGTFYSQKEISIGRYNGAEGTIYVTKGNLVSNSTLILGEDANTKGTLVVTGGVVSVNGQIQVANNASAQECNVIVSNGLVNCSGLMQTGFRSTGTFEMEGGEVSCSGFRLGTDNTAAVGTAKINGGYLHSTSDHFYIGNNGTGSFYMNGGEVYCANQFWLGNNSSSAGTFIMTNGSVTVNSYTRVGHGSGNGLFIMDGGTYSQNSEKFIIGQGGDSGKTGECIVSNGTINVNGQLWISENATPGVLVMEGGEFNVTGVASMSRNSGAGKGRINLNGGVLTVNNYEVGNAGGAGGEIIFNGGVLRARSDQEAFIPYSDKVTLTLDEGGAVIDSNGKSITIADTFENADSLVGNGMIAKKGLGTLTISSNLDLERTFKFTINTDLGASGVGPIALTGSNTLDAGDKITVEIDPVNAETNVAYTVMTGLGELTMDDIVLAGTDFYSYTGEVTDGTLSVTLQYGPTAPITARYDNGAWGVYDADGNLIPEGSAADLTTYVFTGSEPAGDFENYATTHKVVLVATGIGVTNTINISSNVNAHHLAVSTDEGCAVVLSGDFTLAADSLVNSGTLIFDGNVTLSGVVNYPFYIAEGARVTLVTPQTIGGEISGTGTLALTGGTFGYQKTDETTIMDAFAGTLVLCAGSQLDTQYNRRGNPDKFHIMLGTARVRMEGATLTVPNDNEAYIYNEVDIVSSTENVIQGWNNALCLNGRLIGGGTVTLRCPGNRGGRIQGDASDFTGTCIIENAFGANGGDEGFHSANAGSQNATWVLPADGICSEEYKKTYYVGAQDATIYFGAFQQTGAKAYVCIATTGTSIQIGNLAGGESVIEGRFTNNPFTLSKVGADSWLTLGTNFNMVAGSTVNIAEGGLGFNLPEGETVTALTNATVSISPSATARVSMTAAQYAALDTAQIYTLAKLASSPGVSKLATVLSVDGEVPQGKNADKWRVCFKFVGATVQEDAHYEAVLGYFAPGFVIIVQ